MVRSSGICRKGYLKGSARCQDLGETMLSHVWRDAFYGANHLIVDKSGWANFTHKYAKGRKPGLNNRFGKGWEGGDTPLSNAKVDGPILLLDNN